MLHLSRRVQRTAVQRLAQALRPANVFIAVAPVAVCQHAASLSSAPPAFRGAARSLATQTAAAASPTAAPLTQKQRQQLEWNNVTEGIASKIGVNLHLQPGHPLNIIKNRIVYYFEQRAEQSRAAAASEPASPTATGPPVFDFVVRDNLPPHVTVAQNFDSLLFPADHVGRSLSDTFYYDRQNLLRTHTTAHEVDLLRSGLTNFLTVGDCYRRDEIDASHYPVFHQFEGVRVFAHDMERYNRGPEGVQLVEAELKSTLEGLVRYLFGADAPIRWVEGSFPFTYPSFEMEVMYRGNWLEVLGCGVLQHAILDATVPDAQKGKVSAWAFGMGLERLAMVLFDIPDIRLFWSRDPRFLRQFDRVKEDLRASQGRVTPIKFVPFSKYPACFKDVSFWIPKEVAAVKEPAGSSAGGEVKPSHDGGAVVSATQQQAPEGAFHENDLCSLVREVAGDLVENVTLQDSFVHPKTGQASKCYRIMYRALDRNLTNEEIDVLQEQIREQIPQRLGLQLR